MVDSKQFVWTVLATDVDFGPDGALYFCDWVEGWDKPNKGRIYRVLDESRRGDPAVREVKDAAGAGNGAPRGSMSSTRLLAHADMRVRQEAQFELAARGEPAWQTLATVAGSKARHAAADSRGLGAGTGGPGAAATARRHSHVARCWAVAR